MAETGGYFFPVPDNAIKTELTIQSQLMVIGRKNVWVCTKDL